MTKKTGKMGAEAPEVKDPKSTKKTVQNENVFENMTASAIAANTDGLDPNHRVDLLHMMHETFRKDPMAASHTGMSQENVNNINKVTAVMQIAVLACEVTLAKNPFTMLISKPIVDNIIELGAEVGIHLDTKALPAPDENGNVKVSSEAITVSDKTKKAVKEEVAVMEEVPETDGSKVKDEEGVRKGGIFILADTKADPRPYARINSLIRFYRDYLYFKAGDDEAAKKAVSDTPNEELFSAVAKIIGPCPFSMHGVASLLYSQTASTKSPVSAFCMFRNSTLDKTTGHPTLDDAAVASMVKTLIIWCANSKIADATESIETCENNVKVLSKNKKQNATAIKKEQDKITTYKSSIDAFKDVITFVTNPSTEIADALIDAYDNKEHEHYKNSHRLACDIMKTYYPGVEAKKVKHDCFLHNMQQYIGVVTNLFRDPLQQSIAYKEANITELVIDNGEENGDKKEEKGEEKK